MVRIFLLGSNHNRWMPYKNVAQQKAAQRAYYEVRRNQYSESNRRIRTEKRAWLRALKEQPCMDCGGEFPDFVMEFHHRDPLQKEQSVAWLLINAGRQRVLDEIAKCDLLCANCHRIREYGERDVV